MFKIKSSKRSNNGTDVGSGQIPELLYKIPEVEQEDGVQIQLLDRDFSCTVSPVCWLVVCLFVCFCLQFGLQGFLVFFFGLQFSVTRVLFVYSCVTEVLFVVYCFCLHFLFMVWHHAIVSPLGWFECCVASS